MNVRAWGAQNARVQDPSICLSYLPETQDAGLQHPSFLAPQSLVLLKLESLWLISKRPIPEAPAHARMGLLKAGARGATEGTVPPRLPEETQVTEGGRTGPV